MRHLMLLPALLLASTLSAQEGPVVTYSAEKDYGFARQDLETAILERGLVVDGVSHIGEMLARTAGDLNQEAPVFAQAESLEFCSALLTHRMTRIDPANITVCPFAVSIYTLAEAPETVYVSYRRPQLLGDEDGAVVEDVLGMLDDIARGAVE